MKAAVFLGVGRRLRSVHGPWQCRWFSSQTRLTLAHVQGRGREEPRWLGRGPQRFRQRGDSPTLLRRPVSLALGRGRGACGGLEAEGGASAPPGAQANACRGRWSCGSGGSPCTRSASNTRNIDLCLRCLVPGTRTGLPPRGAASWGPVESRKVLVSHWCLQAACFPGWEPSVLSVTRRYPGTTDAVRPGQEGGAGGNTGWRGGAGRCCLEEGAPDR